MTESETTTKKKRRVRKTPFVIERRTTLYDVQYADPDDASAGRREIGDPHTAWVAIDDDDLSSENEDYMLSPTYPDAASAEKDVRMLKPGHTYRIVAVKRQMVLRAETVTKTTFEEV